MPAEKRKQDAAAAPDGDRSQTYSVPGENPLDAGNRLFSAIELACLDLIGRALGRPVCDLLGGRARSAVPFCSTSSRCVAQALPMAPSSCRKFGFGKYVPP